MSGNVIVGVVIALGLELLAVLVALNVWAALR